MGVDGIFLCRINIGFSTVKGEVALYFQTFAVGAVHRDVSTADDKIACIPGDLGAVAAAFLGHPADFYAFCGHVIHFPAASGHVECSAGDVAVA